jgi:hypothetical protein
MRCERFVSRLRAYGTGADQGRRKKREQNRHVRAAPTPAAARKVRVATGLAQAGVDFTRVADTEHTKV